MSNHVRGHAEGWSVYEDSQGGWRWSVYTARGGSMGVANSEIQAEGLARLALASLRRGAGLLASEQADAIDSRTEGSE
jgi:hypothetical protein